ncbi:MAG: hypothetical protein WBE50_11445, partial [Methyloceanibacter sp.]
VEHVKVRGPRRPSHCDRTDCRVLPCLRQPINQPQLILKRRTQTEDYVQLAEAWEAANTKLGWIV